jgi:hypothetical protein
VTNERLTNSFVYEHCDVPEGVSLAEWRTARQSSTRRRSQATTGMFAALSTFTPQVLRSRAGRAR